MFIKDSNFSVGADSTTSNAAPGNSWIKGLTGTTKWSGGTFTYSIGTIAAHGTFAQANSNLLINGTATGTYNPLGTTGNDAALITDIRTAFDMIGAVISGLSFSETTDFTGSNTDMKLIGFDNLNARGWGTFPGTDSLLSGGSNNYESYIILSTTGSSMTVNALTGAASNRVSTSLHEILHGLGLAHPHDTGHGTTSWTTSDNLNASDDELDNRRYTVMSYERQGLDTDLGTLGYGSAATPMALDVAALHHLYGSSANHTGNTTYTLTDPETAALDLYGDDGNVSIGRAFYSIWDTQGDEDNISYAGANRALINLNEATLDTTADPTHILDWIDDISATSIYAGLSQELKNDLTDADYHAGGFFSRVFYNNGSAALGGYSIANGLYASDTHRNGAVIENAIGGNQSDILIGNEQSNTLTGNSGNDLLHGSGGDDRLIGGSGTDTLFGGEGQDSAVYSGAFSEYTITHNGDGTVTIAHTGGSGADDTDTLTDVECAEFTDRHVALDPLTGPLDVVFLQDLTGSFSDDLPYMQSSVDDIASRLLEDYSGSRFAVTSFKDTGDPYVYQVEADFTNSPSALASTYAGLEAAGGGDFPEAQLTAMVNAAIGAGLSYQTSSSRLFVIATDASYHPYQDITALAATFEANNIIPVFAVTSGQVSTYQGLVDQLGTGVVVTITSNSSDFADSIRYALAEINCEVTAVGDSADNTIAGTDGFMDAIYGLGGNDVLSGLGGDDTLDGGSGADSLSGDVGNDHVIGGSGDDTVYGGAGHDRLEGNEGDDILRGDLDEVYTGSGLLVDPTGSGNYSVATAASIDGLFNQADHPNIIAPTTIPHVTIEGTGDGNVRYYSFTILEPNTTVTFDIDIGYTPEGSGAFDSYISLYDGAGNLVTSNDDGSTSNGAGGSVSSYDSFLTTTIATAGLYVIAVGSYPSLSAVPVGGTYALQVSIAGSVIAPSSSSGAGDDILVGGAGADYLSGGGGYDTADYSSSDAGVAINLAADYANGGDATGDTLVSIEKLIGSAHNDILRGDASGNVIAGGQGGDILDGQGGLDTVDYSASTAGVAVNLKVNYANGGDATGDTISNFERARGSSHDDRLVGSDVGNRLFGGAGNDFLDGGGAGDLLYGEAGDDILVGGAGADYLSGGGGYDTADYSTSDAGVAINLAADYANGGDATGDTLVSIEKLIGSAHNDILRGDASGNVIAGGQGNDTLTGYGSNDTFVFKDNDGHDRITDFETSADVVVLLGVVGFTSFADVQAALSQDGFDTVLDFGDGQTIRFEDKLVSSLTADDFNFL
ncbi:hypothetical protein [Roseibium sediminicola]|uniref:VWFA domain-containing protein n=1 Tax=Roseibium sediminicola TaxID=2933272 RepID=A0ABT0H3J6_9HYPH|nr:hypothetical protein [Roseibium sp. CAU 1639]MCK7616264.1 hypothetical protein [Roseibium sp. CAU 1639]